MNCKPSRVQPSDLEAKPGPAEWLGGQDDKTYTDRVVESQELAKEAPGILPTRDPPQIQRFPEAFFILNFGVSPHNFAHSQ